MKKVLDSNLGVLGLLTGFGLLIIAVIMEVISHPIHDKIPPWLFWVEMFFLFGGLFLMLPFYLYFSLRPPKKLHYPKQTPTQGEQKWFLVFGHDSNGEEVIVELSAEHSAGALKKAREYHKDCRFNHVNLANADTAPNTASDERNERN